MVSFSRNSICSSHRHRTGHTSFELFSCGPLGAIHAVVYFLAVMVGLEVGIINATDDINLLIKKLKSTAPAEERVIAARTLIKRSSEKVVLELLPVIDALTADENEDVRFECILLKLFLLKNHQRECPLEVFQWIKDPSEKIRINVSLMMQVFENFPEGFLEELLVFFDSLNLDAQADYLVFLVEVGGKEKRVQQRLITAIRSKHAGQRFNGTVAIWKATRDVQLILPIYLQRVSDIELLVDFIAQKEPTKQFPLTGKHAVTRVTLGYAGLGMTLHNLMVNHKTKLIHSIHSVIDMGDAQQKLRLIRYIQLGLAIGAKEKREKTLGFKIAEMTPLLPSLKKLSADTNSEISDLANDVVHDIEVNDDNRFLTFLKRYENPRGDTR